MERRQHARSLPRPVHDIGKARRACAALPIVLFTILCALVLAGCGQDGGASEPQVRVKQSSYSFEEAMDFMSEIEAQPFTLPTADGGEVSLSDFEGDVLFLCFTEAGNALNGALLDMLDGAAGRDDMRVLLVVRGEGALEDGAACTVALDADGGVFSMPCYFAQATPVCYVVDRNGVIRIPVPGVVNMEMLDVFMDYMRALDE